MTTLTKEELTKTQKQIDSMTDEELKQLNKNVEQYALDRGKEVRTLLQERYDILVYAYKRHKQLRRQKVQYPFWRCKGAVELVLMELDYKVTKFTTGFNITIGDTATDLFELRLYFDDGLPRTEVWFKVYGKTKVRTPEEQAAYDLEIQKSVEEKIRKQWNRNCKKYGLTPEQFGKTFIDEKTGEKFVIDGLRPRQKKFPISCKKIYDDPDKKPGYYNITVEYFKTMKEVKE